jgi:hypothetical protein
MHLFVIFNEAVVVGDHIGVLQLLDELVLDVGGLY